MSLTSDYLKCSKVYFNFTTLDLINKIVIIAPACLAVLAEHIIHLIVTGKISESKGMAFAAVVGVALSIVLYILGKFGIMNEEYKIRFNEGSSNNNNQE